MLMVIVVIVDIVVVNRLMSLRLVVTAEHMPQDSSRHHSTGYVAQGVVAAVVFSVLQSR